MSALPESGRARAAALALIVGLAAAAGTPAAPVLDAGCLYRSGPALDGTPRVRALGPIVEWSRAADGSELLAVRPFYSRFREPRWQRTTHHFLWPLASYRRFGEDVDWRVLLFFGHDFNAAVEGDRYRLWLFPFLMGRDARGESYAGLFPLYGSVHEFIGQDEIDFVLFPLYARLQQNDQETVHWLWPLISRTTAPGLERFRVLPFYGRASCEGVYEKRTILWPFWSSVRYLDPREPGHGFLLFPLYGRVETTQQTTWTVLPPLIRWSEGPTLRERNVPWPFVQTSAGETDKFYLWPLWGWKSSGDEVKRFYLWPFVEQRERHSARATVRRFELQPVVFVESWWDASPPPPDLQPAARYVRVWPLMSYAREGEHKRVRVPDLWFAKRTRPIERNLAPLWTLYTHESGPGGFEDELLWGLFRYRRQDGAARGSVFPLVRWERDAAASGRREWDVLYGLVGYRREGDARGVTLAYVPLGGAP